MLDALLSWDGWTVTQLPAEQAAIFRLEGAPPSEEFPFIQESEALEILFCRKGGLILEWAGHRRLSLSADQVLFLPVRTEAYRGQFASESFYGTLVRMEAKAAWSALRAMHSDLGESISRAWNDPCMLIHQYLLEQRMAQAAELLTTTTQSVLQISTAVGYSSVSQFGIAFKQRYHMSPSQFRRNANKNPFATVFVRNG